MYNKKNMLKTLGSRIKEIRNEKGINVIEISDELNITA